MIQRPFPRTTPEAVGISSGDVQHLLDRLCTLPEGQEVHHFMLLRHGMVAAEGSFTPYRPDAPHDLCSVSKALTGTAVGFAVQEGLLDMDEPITEILPDKLPEELQPEMKQETVRVLMEMGAGQAAGDAHGGIKGTKRLKWTPRRRQKDDDGDLAKKFFNTPILYEPGSVFGYNGMCSYLLGLAVTRRSGLDLMEYLKPRLFDPLGIEMPYAERDGLGFCLGQSGVCLSAEELAAIGWFYMQDGKWNGEQLLDADWVREAKKQHLPTKSQVGDDWSQGYCWQFWRGTHNTFRFCGAFGQMCVCVPDYDAIFVVESGADVAHMHDVLDCFYDTILGHFSGRPLPEDPNAAKALRIRCANLGLAEPTGALPSTAWMYNGHWSFKRACPVETVSLACEGDEARVKLSLRSGTTLSLRAGFRAPAVGLLYPAREDGKPGEWSATAWFEDNNDLHLRARAIYSYGRMDLRFRLEGETLLMELNCRRMDVESKDTVFKSV